MTHGRYCESCGWFHDQTDQTCLFIHNGNGCSNIQNAVVDCTLSLGPPSTTVLSERDKKKKRRSTTSSPASSFTDTNKNTSKTTTYSDVLPSSNRRISGGGDTLLDRRCTNCDTTSTPLWRNGPRGPKSLCNACGIRFKKEERRTMNPLMMTAGSAVTQDQYGHHPSSYSSNHNATDQSGSSTCSFVASEMIMLNHDYGGAGEYYRRDPIDGVNGLPFHSWRLNVADTATGLVYDDFTR